MVNLKTKDGKSLYFANRKEYYRRIKISKSLIDYHLRKKGGLGTIKEIIEEIKNIKSVYFIKFIYESNRDKHHNLMVEVKMELITKTPPSNKEVKQLVYEQTQETLRDVDFIRENYTDLEIGLASQEETTEAPGVQTEIINFSRRL